MGFDKSKFCFSVLCSNKEGADLLALCPDSKKHGDLNSTFHKPFKGFNRAAFHKKYGKAATPEQMKAANWVSLKKPKV